MDHPSTDSFADRAPPVGLTKDYALTSSWRTALPVLAWALMSLPAFYVRPAGDDWMTFAPLSGLSWSLLRPHVLWRPFEPIFRWLMGLWAAQLFPGSAHALVIAGHAFTGWWAYKILRETGVGSAVIAGSVGMMLLFPGSAAAVWSVDSAIQTWSTACALWSVLVLLRSQDRQWPVAWLAPLALAMLWKESAVGWTLGAPCMVGVLSKRTRPYLSRRLLRASLLGLALLGVYLVCRMVLGDAMPRIGAESRYTLAFSPATIARNLIQLFGVVTLPVDTLALLGRPRVPILVAVTAAMGAPMLLLTIWRWIRTQTFGCSLLGLASVICAALPHLIIPHVSEMYAHPVIAATVLLVAPLFDEIALARRHLLAPLACLFLGTVVSNGHKLHAMIASGEGGRAVGRRIADQYPVRARLVCSIPFWAAENGYSVFQIAPGPASGWGKAVLQEWGWPPDVDFVRMSTIEECRAVRADLVVKFTGADTFEASTR